MTNYYKILGVKKDSTQEEIKSSYKNLIKKYHPDLYQGDKAYAEKKTKEINGAYEVLSDPEARKQYDLEMFPPAPTYGYYSSSSDNYSYTPPKYDNPPSDYYSKYKSQYSNPGREYNYNDFANYHADKRYTNYHRSKTPNSNYKDQKTEDVSTKMMNIFDTFSKNKKFFAIIFVIILYCILFMSTIGKFNDYMSGKSTGPLLNEDKRVPITHIPSTEPDNQNTVEKDEPNRDYNQVTREEFDIYDYYTEEELRTTYRTFFLDEYSTYSAFIEAMSDTLYFHLFESTDKNGEQLILPRIQ